LGIYKACTSAGSIRGEKNAFIAHILGRNKVCIHASAEAISVATALKLATTTGTSSTGTSSAAAVSSNKRGHISSSASSAAKSSTSEPPAKKMKQGNLMAHAYKGVDMPFSPNEVAAVQAQALRATISANLPFQVYENPEVIKLFGMLRTAAPDIMPSAKVVGGRLLNEAAEVVELKMDKLLRKKNLGLV
jgi:hypothetical protein